MTQTSEYRLHKTNKYLVEAEVVYLEKAGNLLVFGKPLPRNDELPQVLSKADIKTYSPFIL
jgi:hypothetical protein